MLRSCLRAVDAISRIPDAESVASFKALLQVQPRISFLPPVSFVCHASYRCVALQRMHCSTSPSPPPRCAEHGARRAAGAKVCSGAAGAGRGDRHLGHGRVIALVTRIRSCGCHSQHAGMSVEASMLEQCLHSTWWFLKLSTTGMVWFSFPTSTFGTQNCQGVHLNITTSLLFTTLAALRSSSSVTPSFVLNAVATALIRVARSLSKLLAPGRSSARRAHNLRQRTVTASARCSPRPGPVTMMRMHRCGKKRVWH
jgi:hypothetical protein